MHSQNTIDTFSFELKEKWPFTKQFRDKFGFIKLSNWPIQSGLQLVLQSGLPSVLQSNSLGYRHTFRSTRLSFNPAYHSAYRSAYRSAYTLVCVGEQTQLYACSAVIVCGFQDRRI